MSLLPFSVMPNLDSFFSENPQQHFAQEQSLPALLLGSPISLNPVDILDTGKELRVSIANPNIPLANVQTEVKGNILTIKGQFQRQQQKHDKNLIQRNFSHNVFFQQVKLPTSVDNKQVHLHIDENKNLLLVTLPKTNFHRFFKTDSTREARPPTAG